MMSQVSGPLPGPPVMELLAPGITSGLPLAVYSHLGSELVDGISSSLHYCAFQRKIYFF